MSGHGELQHAAGADLSMSQPGFLIDTTHPFDLKGLTTGNTGSVERKHQPQQCGNFGESGGS